MAAGDGDAVFDTHQLGKEFAARDHRNLAAASFDEFRIVIFDGGTDNQGTGITEIFSLVPFENDGAQLLEPLSDRAEAKIRPTNLETQIDEHFGNPAHADSSDPREMKMLGL
jgi:hypothetical protein